MKLLRILAGSIIASVSACSGSGGSSNAPVAPAANAPADTTLLQQGMPAPFNPKTDALTSLDRTTLGSVQSADSGYLAASIRGPASLRGPAALRSTQSTIQTGDPGFYAGLGIKGSVTAVYAILSAYEPTQASIPYPPSGETQPPVIPERLFGPEISPAASCLSAGVVMVNFGPGGTQRNGPGNPIQSLSGPYNAFRVLDFCNPTPNAAGQPQPVTFFLTPIDTTFAQRYVRPNESGLPSVVTEVFSEDDNAATNAHATWYAILWNFAKNRWDVMNTSKGNTNAPGAQGIAMVYEFSTNLPKVCPTIPPLIAQDIYLLDHESERFVEPGPGKYSDLAHAVLPGTSDPAFSASPSSLACFQNDATGKASYSFGFLPGKRLADWELKQTAAAEPAPIQ